ncbi:hypothetical protein HETIRDRAFT_451857 [Heterobasidion irregulare TC 32-1]|uniref:DUF6533 domain-containing protein n=1 Tax=Heterobasidion irregulare (strain TC 32-1) TaxID=747525 RepID=W4K917_HETIT|nr:uncharacterized protein HETIRDRAFT_451857 [Heterobasidion irregulare TC 32-1]ETW82317.1 hypothetical protein HETIRDRAFT_451857 [Heterobasidion irregulare TC 32-1]
MDIIWRTNLVSYFHVCAATILASVYDYVLTFRREIEHIWGSRLSVAKILFFLTRYSAFLDITVMMCFLFVKHPSGPECSLLFKLFAWLVSWGLALSELLIILRTWALWACDRRIGIGLGLLLTVGQIVNCVADARFQQSLTFEPMANFLSHVDRGCVMTGGSRILLVGWGLLIAFDTPVSLANVVIVSVAPAEYTNLLASVQRVLYGIFPSRILLNIRQASQMHDEPTSRWSQVLGPGLSFARYDADDDRVHEEGEQ